MLCKDLRCLKLYRHVWSLMMRKDQNAMMSLLCGRPLSLHVARIAARHLLDEGGIVLMTVTEIP
jgi:hypothetical protein